MNIEYRLLGRLEVVIDGVSVDLGSRRQRALLALLVTNAGKVLSTDRIIDELWGGSGTTDKTNTLWVHMSGLRAALQPDRPKRSEGTVLFAGRPPHVRVDRARQHRRRTVRTISRRGTAPGSHRSRCRGSHAS